MNENSAEAASAETPPGERACAYRILRYTPNLVRDEWVNIGVLLYDPSTGERRLRVMEEQDEYNRVRRLHPQADEALLRALRDDLEDRFKSESAPLMVRTAAAPTGNSFWASGTIPCPTHCSWPRKKASSPQTSTPNWSDCTPTMWLCSAPRAAPEPPEAARKCACTARRFSGKRVYGSALKNPFARQSLLSPATPCVWITAIGATARAGLCSAFP
jgi:hypothetical protein